VRSAAARAAVSHQTAYRARLACPVFRRGWDAALLAARALAEETLASRAIDGVEEEVLYHGEGRRHPHRYDPRARENGRAREGAAASMSIGRQRL
jgi:hypothetical protein